MKYLNTYIFDIITKHYFDFKGREGRRVFWLFSLNIFIISFILETISPVFFSVIIPLVVLLPSLGIGVRRLHDINFSGWWMLIGFIPLIGSIALIVFACLPGTEGENKYGPVVVNTDVKQQ